MTVKSVLWYKYLYMAVMLVLMVNITGVVFVPSVLLHIALITF